MANDLQPHELASFYPMHDKSRLNDLVDGMKQSGYRAEFPIVLYEGKILDGRNRYNAAIEAGVNPVMVEFGGDDPIQFVIQANSNRRDLDVGQRAAIGLKIQKYWNDLAKANQSTGGAKHQGLSNLTNPINSREKAAKVAGVSTGTIATVAKLEKDAPDLFERVASGSMPTHKADKELKTRKRTEARAEIARAGAKVEKSERWHVYHGDIATWQAPRQYDYIITDPPYPKEFLPLWEVLARRAKEWLKPNGMLIAMSGHFYVNTIYSMLDKHLAYYWTGAYLTPGQTAGVAQRRINPQWKPLLIYTLDEKYSGKTFSDVFTSGGNDKDNHKWGQSESGMFDIVSKICLEGQYILDPFCGAGTTGIAALKHGCLFDGLELDSDNVNISKGRLNEY